MNATFTDPTLMYRMLAAEGDDLRQPDSQDLNVDRLIVGADI